MTQRIAALLLTFTALCLAGTAHAYEGWYLGGSVHTANFDDSASGVDLDTWALGFIGGYRFNRFIGVEGNFRAGVIDDSVTVFVAPDTPVDFKVGLDTYFAVSAVGRLPVTQHFDLYGRVGYGRSSFTFRGFNVDFSNDTDFAFGAGVHAQIGTVLVRAGWERLLDTGDVRLQGFELSLIYELL